MLSLILLGFAMIQRDIYHTALPRSCTVVPLALPLCLPLSPVSLPFSPHTISLSRVPPRDSLLTPYCTHAHTQARTHAHTHSPRHERPKNLWPDTLFRLFFTKKNQPPLYLESTKESELAMLQPPTSSSTNSRKLTRTRPIQWQNGAKAYH